MSHLNPQAIMSLCIAKFDPAGQCLWLKQAGTLEGASAGVVVDQQDALYLNGTGCFGSGLFLAKWDGTGNVTWATALGGGNANRDPVPGRMLCDSAGNLHMVAMGEFSAHESWDLLVGKWAPDGTLLRTTNQFVVSGIPSVSTEGLGGFVIDKQDNLYLSMKYRNGALIGTNRYYCRSDVGLCVLKCDADGNLDWLSTADGPQAGYSPANLGLDSSGNVFLTGFFQDTLDFGSTTLSSRGTKDVFVAKLAVTPVVVAAPQSQVVLAGKEVVFSVAVGSNGPFEFQWLHYGVVIPGATNQTLVLNQVGPADAGEYSVVVKNEFGQASSDPATLVINPEGVEISLFSGLTIVGNVGQSYSVGYVTNVTDTNYISLTNLTLSTPSQFWIDPQPATQGKRFYLVKPLP